MKLDVVIAGGTLVTAEATIRADIGIRGQKISAIAPDLTTRLAPGVTVIDASKRYVIPGGIDTHVHLDLPVGGIVTADDYASGTEMAACGGVTTLIDFATPSGNETLQQALDNWHARAAGKACIDYAFHMSLTNLARQAREIPSLIAQGVPTFKQYMIYAHEGLQSSDADIYHALELLRDLKGLLLVHAESPQILDMLIERHHQRAAMQANGARLHTLSRPNVVEAEAVSRCIHWARATHGPLFFVHLSTAEAVALVREAQADHVPVLAETCAHYLLLDDQVFSHPDGHLYATCPQVKHAADRRELWHALQSGVLSSVSTDTCSFTRQQKARWHGDWTRIPMGLPGLETLLPIVYTHGVLKGRLTINDFVRVCCTNPARMMGLYPRKGTLSVGADADVVIFHPTTRRRVDWRALHSQCDWNPYQGRLLAGFPEYTLSRGCVLVSGGEFVGEHGHGQFVQRANLRRPLPPAVATAPDESRAG